MNLDNSKQLPIESDYDESQTILAKTTGDLRINKKCVNCGMAHSPKKTFRLYTNPDLEHADIEDQKTYIRRKYPSHESEI